MYTIIKIKHISHTYLSSNDNILANLSKCPLITHCKSNLLPINLNSFNGNQKAVYKV